MKKSKKILSLLLSASMAVTSFAGLALTANAEDLPLSVSEAADGTITVKKTTDAEVSAVVIKASYGDDAILDSLSSKPETFTEAETALTDVTLTDGDKLYIWDSLSAMKPLADAYAKSAVTPTESTEPTPTDEAEPTPTEEAVPTPTETVEPEPTGTPTVAPATPTPRPTIDPSIIKYSQDYESETDASSWVSPNFQAALSLETDNTNYIKYDHNVDTGTNTRGAYTDFGDIAAGTDYAIEFDLAVTSGNNQTSEFAVKGSDFAYTSNNANYGAGSGYVFKMTIPANTTTYTIDSMSGAVTLDAGTMYHYTLAVKGLTSYITIEAADGTKVVDSQLLVVNGAGGLSGLYYNLGRYTGVMAIDNIVVRDLYENEVPDIQYYTINVNTTRYTKMATNQGETYYADADGKIEIPLLTDGYNVTYTLSKEGFETRNGEITIEGADVTVDEPLTQTVDAIYYESDFGNEQGAWITENGSRSDSIDLGTIELPEMSNIKADLTFTTFGDNSTQQKTWAIVTDGGKLAGLQFTKESGVVAWTGWTGTADMNQSSDLGAYTNSAKIADYTVNQNLVVNFVVDKENKAITVSCGDVSVSLDYTIDATSVTGLSTGLYRYYGGLNTNLIEITEPNATFMSVSGDNEFAKIEGQTVSRTYTKTETVITPGETFTWSVVNSEGAVPEGVAIDENGVLTVADTAVAGDYTITCTGSSSSEKTASVKVKIDDFAEVVPTVDGPKNMTAGETNKCTLTALKDSTGDDVLGLFTPAWSSSDESIATVDENGNVTAVANGNVTITCTVGNASKPATASVAITVATYSISAEATGDSTTVDLTGLVKDSSMTGCLVTTADASGNMVKQTEVEYADSITVDTTGAASVEVSPIREKTSDFSFDIPAGRYDFTVTKTTTKRTDFYVNDQLILNNVDQYGANRSITEGTTDTAEDIFVGQGYANVNLQDNQGAGIAKVVIKKVPSNVTRKTRVYTLGDSLVCNYYGEGAEGATDMQTGWGQVIDNYIADDYAVTNIANSGVYAVGIYDTQFTQIRQSAMPGDIVLLESGYNDKTYSSTAVLTEYVTKMIDECYTKGVKIILVSPNASTHDYKESVAWTGTMAEIAANTNTPYIDLSKLSYDFLNGLYGTDTETVRANYNLSTDSLHSSYLGAMKWAEIVSQGMYDLGFTDAVNTSFSYEFTDTVGNNITCQVKAAE